MVAQYDEVAGSDGVTRSDEVTAPDTAGTAAPRTRSADEVLIALYDSHYRPLVRLATLLVRDVTAAEEVVQDAFVAMHGSWKRLRDPTKAAAYLRRSVVNGCRSHLRHRAVVERHPPAAPSDEPSAEHHVMNTLERDTIMSALRRLPARQREALVLRYYADLSEPEIAKAMGISRGSVKSHTFRGIAALRSTLERPS
ncbi:MAG: SigE family RNA polymerase sigma factor [Streptosporangiaceae bacterium]